MPETSIYAVQAYTLNPDQNQIFVNLVTPTDHYHVGTAVIQDEEFAALMDDVCRIYTGRGVTFHEAIMYVLGKYEYDLSGIVN